MPYDIERLKGELQIHLDAKRYAHTLGVVKSAIELAKTFGADEKDAEFAAYFHDYAKRFTKNEIDFYVEKYDILLDKFEKISPNLAHGKIASYICKYEYNVENKQVLNAIKYHTTGRKGMKKLEKIICLADYIEENRNFDGVEKLRILAKKDLDLALYNALNGTIVEVTNKNVIIHKNTINARNYILQLLTLNNQQPYL